MHVAKSIVSDMEMSSYLACLIPKVVTIKVEYNIAIDLQCFLPCFNLATVVNTL